jgi:DNA-binding HxlR family transcriptional regulator
LHILTALYYGKLRFKELEREISDVSAKVLAKELKDLETAGVVNRQVFTTVPVTVEYSLTQNGKSLKPVLEQMRIWSVQYKRFTPR